MKPITKSYTQFDINLLYNITAANISCVYRIQSQYVSLDPHSIWRMRLLRNVIKKMEHENQIHEVTP